MLDMDQRLAPVRARALGVLALALALSIPWVGPWTLAPLAGAAALFKLAERRARKSDYAEYLIFGTWIIVEFIIAAAIALTAAPKDATLGWLLIPIATLPARFPERTVKIGTGIALSLLMGIAFATDASAVLRDPTFVIAHAAEFLSVSMLLLALLRSDLKHRDESEIDQLTGLLNRKALVARVHKLEQHSLGHQKPVGVIASDIDNFKQINDKYGHDMGDHVLAEVAQSITERMRVYDLIYRLGGDEILILLPGTDLQETMTLAERLRHGVNVYTPDGDTVTISLGVSASASEEAFSFQRVCREADTALYDAKKQGRNCVRVASADKTASIAPTASLDAAIAAA